MFHNIWDNLSHWLIFFRGVGIPPTVICFAKVRLPSKKNTGYLADWPTVKGSLNFMVGWAAGVMTSHSIRCWVSDRESQFVDQWIIFMYFFEFTDISTMISVSVSN